MNIFIRTNYSVLRRVLSLLAAVMLVMCAVPAQSVFAAEGATVITSGSSTDGNFDSLMQTDTYSFSAENNGRLSLSLACKGGISGADTLITAEVTDLDGNLISAFSLPCNAESVTSAVGLSKGEYLISLRCEKFDAQPLNYSLGVELDQSASCETEFNDNASTASPITSGVKYLGAINIRDDRDFFVADLTAKESVFSFTGGKNGSWELSVYDMSMNQLAHGTGAADKTTELAVKYTGKVLLRVMPLVYDSSEYSVSFAASERTEAVRLEGRDRIATSISISREGWKQSDNVIIANGYNFADALAGVPLAGALDAPILLTSNNQAPEYDIMAEIERLGAKNVYILGGPNAVDNSIIYIIREYASVTRIAGNNRYETAVKIAEKLASLSGSKAESVFFASATNFPDALAVGSAASIKSSPILYISPTEGLDSATQSYVSSLDCNKAVILGGTVAVSETGAESIQKHFSSVTRISGDNRYETAVKIYREYAENFAGSDVAVATGENFPDALAGGAFAAKRHIPMLLVGSSDAEEQQKIINEKKSDTVYVFGGTNAVGDDVISSLMGE